MAATVFDMLRPKALYPKTQVIQSVPAPIGGLNSKDALAAMPPTDAISLVNWIPDTFGIRCRKGYLEWAKNFPGNIAVESIMSWLGPATTIPGGTFLTDPTAMPGFLFAATKTAVYNITSRTNAPAAAIALSGADNAGWFITSMLTNSAGSFLLACSEADGYFTFDGTAWLRRVAGAGAGQISGVDPNNLVHVLVWKRRAFFVERNSTRIWYLPVDAIAGTVAALDVGPLLKSGGSVAYVANWTIDAGEGIDDILVIVGSNGDVLVYKGTDPTSAATFALVGSWYVGQIPIGRRAYTQYGGDLIIISADGVFPISYVTRGGAAFLQASSKEYTSKIRPSIGTDLRSSFTSRGWDMIVHPSERIMVINVPNYGAVTKKQFCMSTTQNSWCTFQDIPIYSLGSSVGYSFGGTPDGRVLLLFTGFFDNVLYGASVGNGIRGVVQPAFSNFDTPVLTKEFVMVRTNLLAAAAPSLQVGISVNYSITTPIGTPSFAASLNYLWDVALWDAATWAGELSVYSSWTTVGGVGFSGAASLVSSTVADTVMTSVDYMAKVGGPL